MTRIKFFFVSFLMLLGGSNYPSGRMREIPQKDFLNMEGVVVTHLLENSADSLSDNKLIELQQANNDLVRPLFF